MRAASGGCPVETGQVHVPCVVCVCICGQTFNSAQQCDLPLFPLILCGFHLADVCVRCCVCVCVSGLPLG